MDTTDLPKMHAQSPRVQSEDCGHISGKLQAPNLQLLCSTTTTDNSLIMPAQVYPYVCMPERSDHGYAASRVIHLLSDGL